MRINEYLGEISTPTGAIYLRFKEKMGDLPPNASKEEKAKSMYLTAYAGFANKPEELTSATARRNFGKLTNMEDIVKMVKTLFSDKVFISAKTMTIYMDLPDSAFNRHPYLDRFLDWVEENAKGRIKIEWKPGGEGGPGIKKKRKPNPFKGQKIRDVDAADPQYTVTFTVDDRFYREIERRLPNLAKYRGPNRTFVMPNDLFMKFREMAKEQFPRAEIKVVKRVHTSEGMATPSGPEWDRNGGNHAYENSQWGSPEEILRDVQQTLEREVEWPLTEIMDAATVKKLLAPLQQAIAAKINELPEDGELDEKASRAFCTDPSIPRSKMGASNLSSCVSQGFLSHNSGKSVKVSGKRIKLRGTKLKGEKYGGPRSSKAG